MNRGRKPMPRELRWQMVRLLRKHPRLTTTRTVAAHVDEAIRWSA